MKRGSCHNLEIYDACMCALGPGEARESLGLATRAARHSDRVDDRSYAAPLLVTPQSGFAALVRSGRVTQKAKPRTFNQLRYHA